MTAPKRTSQHAWYLLLGLVTLLIRLYRLDGESLFMDEIRQASYYGAGLLQMVGLAASQNQPPLDYWIGTLFHWFSNSDFAVRLPAALFGTGSVLLVAWIVHRLVGATYGLATGLLMALLPYHIYFSQEARPYSIAIFLFLLVLAQVLTIISSARISVRVWIGLFLSSTAFFYSRALDPLAALAGISFLVSIIAVRQAGEIRVWRTSIGRIALGIIAAFGAAFLLFIPLLFKLVAATKQYAPDADHIGLNTLIRGLEKFSLEPLWRAGMTQLEPFGALLLPLALLAPLALVHRANRDSAPKMLILLLLPVIAVIHLFVFLSQTALPFRPPYATYLLPLAMIVTAILVAEIPVKRWSRASRIAAGGGLFLLSAGLLLPNLADYYTTPKHTDWRDAARFLRQNLGEGDLLLMDSFSSYNTWEAHGYLFGRYMDGSQPNIPLHQFHLIPAEALTASTKRPRIFLFFWRDYKLTLYSPYPFIPSPAPIQPIEKLRTLNNNPAIELFQTTGIAILQLRQGHSTGSMARDTLAILEDLLPILNQDDTILDLLLTAYQIAHVFELPQAEEYRQRILQLAVGEKQESVTQILTLLERHDSP